MAELAEIRERNPDTAFEHRDWHLGAVGLVLLGTLLLLVISPLVLLWAYPNASSDVSRRLLVEPAAPQLQTDPSRDLAKFRAEEERKLNTYYWVDKQNGSVHIPIDEAMKKVVAQGIDGFPKRQQ